jgi:hypothetical protein
MGSGARHVTLDDHWGGWNWKKLINLGLSRFFIHLDRFFSDLCEGDSLGKGFPKAFLMKSKHRELAEKFTATFPSSVISTWREMVTAWDADHRKPDPYAEPESGK